VVKQKKLLRGLLMSAIGREWDDSMVCVCYRVDRCQIGYLRFTLEGYDGLGFIRTLDAAQGIIEIAWPASRDADMRAWLAALAGEVSLQAVSRPEDYTAI